jgi:methyl-accepting chemotaxis protein
MSDSKRNDEIGQFQQHFQMMKQSLSTRIHELRQLKETLEEQGEKLNKAHRQILRGSMANTTLLRKIIDGIKTPSQVISNSVDNLCDNYQKINQEVANSEVHTIKQQSEAISALLNQMQNSTEEEEGKEDRHE